MKVLSNLTLLVLLAMLISVSIPMKAQSQTDAINPNFSVTANGGCLLQSGQSTEWLWGLTGELPSLLNWTGLNKYDSVLTEQAGTVITEYNYSFLLTPEVYAFTSQFNFGTQHDVQVGYAGGLIKKTIGWYSYYVKAGAGQWIFFDAAEGDDINKTSYNVGFGGEPLGITFMVSAHGIYLQDEPDIYGFVASVGYKFPW